jgi:hypothetical protein
MRSDCEARTALPNHIGAQVELPKLNSVMVSIPIREDIDAVAEQQSSQHDGLDCERLKQATHVSGPDQ